MSNTITAPAPTTAIRGRRRRSAARAEQPAAGEVALPQLTLRGIVAIWAAAAIPMGLLSWLVAPALADQFSGSHRMVRALLIALTAGLAWQFVLTMILVYREQRTLRWSVVRQALWLRAPTSPRSGRRGGRVWLIVVPLVFAFAAVHALPHIPPVAGRDLGEFLSSDSGAAFMDGAWGWFALIAASFVLNTVIGEELLFRGYLLPRMNGAFGSRDWLANGVIFGLYHVHVPWAIPGALLDTFIVARPSKRHRSALIGIAVHSVQSVFLLVIILTLTLGG